MSKQKDSDRPQQPQDNPGAAGAGAAAAAAAEGPGPDTGTAAAGATETDAGSPETQATGSTGGENAPAPAKSARVAAKPPEVSVYTVNELSAAAGVFAASPELVTAAMFDAKKTTATKAEAAQIIETFRKKEVKRNG